MNKERTFVFLSTLNFILCFVGYELATTLFLPSNSDIDDISKSVTIPYRAFALLVSLLVIGLHFWKRRDKLPMSVKIFFIYWIFFTLRIFYNTIYTQDIIVDNLNQIWLYVFGICLPLMISMIKSYKSIDYDKSLIFIYMAIMAILLLTLFSNQQVLAVGEKMEVRANANVGINTITYGYIGTTGIVLSLFLLQRKNLHFYVKILIIFFMFLSFFSIMRAGSRGPVLSLVFVVLFWIFSRGKHIILSLSVVVLLIILLVMFIDPILSFLGNISPVIEQRLRQSVYENDSSNRDVIYKEAFSMFLNYPIIGKQFMVDIGHNDFAQSHNIILEGLISLGLFGGIIIVYLIFNVLKSTYYLIKKDDKNYWIALIAIQAISENMTSGSIYNSPLLNALIVLVLMYYSYRKQTSEIYD